MQLLDGAFYNLCLQALAEDSIDCIKTFFIEGNLLMPTPKKTAEEKKENIDPVTGKRAYRVKYYQKAIEPIVEKFANTGKISAHDRSRLEALRTESHKSFAFLGVPLELILILE